jgi:hypothetical protein
MSETFMKRIRIGAGAGFAGDRIEPAVELVERARWISCALNVWRNAPSRWRNWRASAIRPPATTPAGAAHARGARPGHGAGVRIVTNMGAANPLGRHAGGAGRGA